MKGNLDVLLIARPGRAQRIYESLLESSLKFEFISFKLFPKWLKEISKSKKMQVCGSNTQNLNIFTLYDYLRFKPKWKWLGKIEERPFFEFFLRRIIKNRNVSLIHYWPNYCYKYIAEYRTQHPDVVTFAEVYLPCEKYIVDVIEPQLNTLGVNMNIEYIRKRADYLDEIMSSENNFICQSEYVANSYRRYYPEKNYFIIPNNLAIAPFYKKKNHISNNLNNCSFVYCGKVSVEKGCDLLLKWFSEHSNYQIHLYGGCETSENQYFSQYRNLNNIHFHGTMPKSELQVEFSKYDAGIHLSRFESFSNAVCEIIGTGLPVVVSDQTGNAEQVQQYGFGEVCQLTPDNITESIMSLITPERYNKCVDNIDKYVQSNPKSYGERIVDFYKERLKNK